MMIKTIKEQESKQEKKNKGQILKKKKEKEAIYELRDLEWKRMRGNIQKLCSKHCICWARTFKYCSTELQQQLKPLGET